MKTHAKEFARMEYAHVLMGVGHLFAIVKALVMEYAKMKNAHVQMEVFHLTA